VSLQGFALVFAAAPAIFIRVSQCPTSTLVLWVVMLEIFVSFSSKEECEEHACLLEVTVSHELD
jgi:hypothetical protein